MSPEKQKFNFPSTSAMEKQTTNLPATSTISPKWIRPAQILGLKRKVKRVANPAVLQQVDPNVFLEKTQKNACKNVAFNPFGKSTPKIEPQSSEPDNSQHSYGHNSSYYFQNKMFPLFDESANLDSTNVSSSKTEEPENEIHSSLPVDWSLKTKIRFASSKPFPWRGTLKTSEEASGVTGFARCIHSTDHQECPIDSSANSKFHQQCLTWMHPFLPWISVFPRLEADQSEKKMPISLFLNSPDLQEILHNEWVDSFHSLFQLLKVRQCPYFYLCAPTFTVLFRAAGIAGSTDTHALITPTSSGFRQALQKESISFSMPLLPSDNKDTLNLTVSEDDDVDYAPNGGDKLNNKEEDDEPHTILESLGLSQDDFPSLNPKRRKMDEVKKKVSSSQTLVFVEGDDVHALFSFLTQTRLCVSATGNMAGIPPTLISPCAFNGGTLKCLKVKQGWVKHRKNDMHCIELSGPIMPNAVQELCSLFSTTQNGNYTSMLATYKPTASFSKVQTRETSFVPSAFATENLKDSGISKTFLKKACKAITPANLAFSEISMEHNLFHCKHESCF